jgi:hypothetical protein
MPRTKLTEKYGRKPTEAAVEIDEAIRAQREADTAAWPEDPTNIAAMEQGRRALELEMAEAEKKKRQHQADIEADDELLDDEPITFDTALEALDDEPPTFETVSVTEPEVLVWTAKAKRAFPPADDSDPFSVGRVEDVTLEMFDRPTGYHMVVVDLEGNAEEVWHGYDRDGFGAALLWKNIRVDPDADYSPIHQLPLTELADGSTSRLHIAFWRREAALDKWRKKVTTPVGGSAEPRSRREMYRDYDLVTGAPVGYSDGVHTWS